MCNFVELSLGNPSLIPYEALSCVWGHEYPTSEVKIWDDSRYSPCSTAKRMNITPSLAQALGKKEN
jgi:hypothetical protein